MRRKGASTAFGVGICLALILVLGLSVTPVSAGGITLKGIRPFSYDHRETQFYRELLTRVNKRMEGRLQIQDVGGSEVYPVTEQFEPVRAGVVDFVISPSSYHMGAFPEGEVMYLTFTATPPELREGGLITALDEICREKTGVAVLAACGYFQYNVYLKKPIKSLADFKGKKIRVAPVYIPVVEGIGAAAVSIPYTETYTALEKGVVDGFCWPSTGAADLGFHEQVSCQVYPYFWTACSQLLYMNAAKLDSLPSDVRDEFISIVKELEAEAVADSLGFVKEELKITGPAGVQPAVISDKEWWQVQELHWEGTKKVLKKVAPDSFERLTKIILDAGWYPPKRVPPVPSS
jgi:TRAP-type C4-dicarboxylate transport system substrate-binding protein